MNQAYPDDLLQRVAVRAAQQAEAEGRSPRPPVSDADLDLAEEQLGFRLHPLLRRLYSEIADGGFGPEYSLLPLAEAVSETMTKAARGIQDPQDGQQRYWPLEAVAILDWGCGMNAVVDCRSPEGAVLLVDPNPGLPDRAGEWGLDSESLAAWLESWLTGINWYTPDADDEFPVEPVPWPDAVARLSERISSPDRQGKEGADALDLRLRDLGARAHPAAGGQRGNARRPGRSRGGPDRP